MLPKGQLYFATGIELDVYAFVPDYCLDDNGECNQAYLIDGWASLNNTNQTIPRGSHVWPDLTRPITKETEQTEAFIKKFDHVTQ